MTIQTAEMDALRNAAASQAAHASIHAGELEQRIAALESAFDSLRLTRPGDGDASPAVKTWNMALEQMQAQLEALRTSRSEAGGEGPTDGQAQFEADFFEVLPEDFDEETASAPLPGLDPELKDALHGALGGQEDRRAEAGEESYIDFTD
jgi:hypothetical protein